MKDFKEFVGLEKSREEKTLAEQMEDDFNENCALSYTQRMWGFGICFCVGWAISILACFTIVDIGTEPEKFATLYTLGNIVAIASTMFLGGPVSQCKKMFDATRWIATTVYLGSIVLTFVVAFTVKEAWLVILCLCVQLLALGWYCLSYIPYGRTMLKNCFGGMCPA